MILFAIVAVIMVAVWMIYVYSYCAWCGRPFTLYRLIPKAQVAVSGLKKLDCYTIVLLFLHVFVQLIVYVFS